MRRVIISSLLIITFSTGAYAATSANPGFTGLWEYPTAEMLPDGHGRMGLTKATPFNHYFIDLSWLPWLEINARFNTFNTIYLGGEERWRRYMDKSMDLKFMLWQSKAPEHWIIPSVAVGITDMMGTELMKAEYAVATWRYKKFATSVGYGTDRLNGMFAGVEYDVDNWLTLKAEYSPLDYSNDSTGGGNRIVPDDLLPTKKYNAGVVLKAPWGMEGSASYQRGYEWVFGISQRLDLKGPYIGITTKKYDSPCEARVPIWDGVDKEELLEKLKEGLEKCVRVRNIDIKLEETDNGRKLYLAYENYGYASHAEAMTRILIMLSGIMPETDELVLIHKNAGVPVVKATFPGSLLFDIRAKTLRGENATHAAVFAWASSADIKEPDEEGFLVTKAQNELKGMFVYDIRIDQTLRETYMDRLNYDVIYNGHFNDGFNMTADVKFPFYNRVDIRNYYGLYNEKDLNDEVRIQQAGINVANKVFDDNDNLWFFAEGGYFDEEWFGTNIWTRYYDDSGRFWIGGRASLTHDRDPFSFGGLSTGIRRYYRGKTYDYRTNNDWYPMAFVQAGYNITGVDLDLNAQWGRFIDNDKGYKLEAIRHWDDTSLGFYYIDTGIRAREDKAFTMAGVHMEIPADKWFGTWFGQPSSHIWDQNTPLISVWRMHSAREGGTIKTPERLMNQLRPAAMKQHVDMLLRDYCSHDNDNDDISQEVTSLLEYLVK